MKRRIAQLENEIGARHFRRCDGADLGACALLEETMALLIDQPDAHRVLALGIIGVELQPYHQHHLRVHGRKHLGEDGVEHPLHIEFVARADGSGIGDGGECCPHQHPPGVTQQKLPAIGVDRK
jgi:hypothetical protein